MDVLTSLTYSDGRMYRDLYQWSGPPTNILSCLVHELVVNVLVCQQVVLLPLALHAYKALKCQPTHNTKSLTQQPALAS